VIDHIRALDEQFQIGDLCFDRWQMDLIAPFLLDMGWSDDPDEETRHLIEFGQGYKSMSPACRVLEELVLAGRLSHGGHEVLAYMMSCVALARDDAENIKPSKRKSSGRIDGVVALAMALYHASLVKLEPEGSAYDDGHGVIVM
jgi:phage terminase large subunit-like protein